MKGIAIVGLGITGVASVRYFLKQGMSVTIHERNDTPAMQKKLEELRKHGNVEAVLGENYLNDLDSYKTVILSPGISPLLPEVIKLKKSDTQVHNDITLFLEAQRGKSEMIGATGSNGKSTVIALMHELFLANGHSSKLGGNIGNSPLDWFSEKEEIGTPVLLEASSAILELFNDKHYFDTVVFVNISSNHLDRYPGGLKEYAGVKRAGVKEGHTVSIVNVDDENSCTFLLPFLKKENVIAVSLDKENVKEYTKALYIGEDKQVIYKDGTLETVLLTNVENTRLLGKHNTYNILTALASLAPHDFDVAQNEKVVQEFKGLPHRLEYVANIDGVTYINDSKSTSPDATKTAISTVATGKNVVLIAGGHDKDMIFENLRSPLEKYVHSIVLLPGGASEKLKNLASSIASKITQYDAPGMEEAVKLARKASNRGDVVLFSPSAGSGGQFVNFEKRGDLYISEVEKYK